MNSVKLIFDFYKTLEEIKIVEKLRPSVWKENSDFLAPCQFNVVSKINNQHYRIEIEPINSDSFVNKENINKIFYFGTPGRIIGKGILKEIITKD